MKREALAERVSLRPVAATDLSIFFEHQQDPEAVQMAAFTCQDPADRTAFDAHWAKISADDRVLLRTVVFDGQVVGHTASFEQSGTREVTYWLDRSCWGQGVATQALAQFLECEPTRPLGARVAADNLGSVRVLEKCGFERAGEETGFANARGEEIRELILTLA